MTDSEKNEMKQLKGSIIRWFIFTALGMAFTVGAWATTVTKDISSLDRRVTVIEQPFIELRTELAATRETVSALRDAVQDLRADIRREK